MCPRRPTGSGRPPSTATASAPTPPRSAGDHTLHAYLAAGQFPPFADPAGRAPITTPFVSVPGLIHGECVDGDGSRYLRITLEPEPGDVRTTAISGSGTPGWGLHVLDMNLAQGDLVDIVKAQSKAHRAQP